MGAKDYLDALVSGRHVMSKVYELGSDERKLHMISTTIADYRKLAQRPRDTTTGGSSGARRPTTSSRSIAFATASNGADC